jgi:hypothetical protein
MFRNDVLGYFEYPKTIQLGRNDRKIEIFEIFPNSPKCSGMMFWDILGTQKRYNSAKMIKKSEFSSFSQTVSKVQKRCLWTFWAPLVSGFGQFGQTNRILRIFPEMAKMLGNDHFCSFSTQKRYKPAENVQKIENFEVFEIVSKVQERSFLLSIRIRLM